MWSLPPWRRAPLLPFGQPAVLLAAAAILACAAASAPLFLSSASSAALQRLLGQQCATPGTAAVKWHGAAFLPAPPGTRLPAAELAAVDRRAQRVADRTPPSEVLRLGT